MTKFTLIAEYPNTKITREFQVSDDVLTDVLEEMRQFLLSAGFEYLNGTELVPEKID